MLDDEEINGEQEANLEIELQNPHPELISFWNEIYSEYFLDAESDWDLTPRDEENDEVVTEDPEEGSGDEIEEPESEPDTEDTDEGEPDSASTAIGYTFSILALFAVLNEFHSAQIMS